MVFLSLLGQPSLKNLGLEVLVLVDLSCPTISISVLRVYHGSLLEGVQTYMEPLLALVWAVLIGMAAPDGFLSLYINARVGFVQD